MGGCSSLYDASLERYINSLEFFISFGPVFTTDDFYNIEASLVFCKDIGLLEAVFNPLLKGGRFFFAASILGISGMTPFPLVAFSIWDLR